MPKRFRRVGLVLVTLLALGLPGAALAQTTFTAVLSGDAEVPAVETAATGSVTATLDGSTLTVTGSFSDLSSAVATDIAGGAHLHVGYAGQNGPVALPLSLTLGEGMTSATLEAADNTFELTDEQITALEGQQMYVNIHSTTYTGGELRGQVLPDAAAAYEAALSSSNEVPAVVSTASGRLVAALDGMTLTVTGAFSGLSSAVATDIAGGAHLHVGYAGQNGPVALPLSLTLGEGMTSATLEAADNTFELTAEQVAALEARQIYANIHSEAFTSGEIRGQMVPIYALGMKAILSGSNAIPTTTSPATGSVMAELTGAMLTVSGAFDGLESDLATEIAGGAHLHYGMAGTSGSVAYPLTVTADGDLRGGIFAASDNRFELSDVDRAALTTRAFYANIHSAAYPSGEIRGQLINSASAAFTALLGGGNEVPANGSQGRGAVLAELAGSTLVVSGAFEGLESDFNPDIGGGAHLHAANAGANGSVVVGLGTTVGTDSRSGMFDPMNNRFTLDAATVAALQARGHYANIHTVDLPSGELRGQLIPTASVQLRAILTGRAEIPGNLSDAVGGAVVELSGNALILSGAFSDLEGDLATDIAGGAHLHLGSIDANGAVVFPLTVDAAEDLRSGTFGAASNTFTLDTDQRAAVRNGLFYVNVHSETHTGGEVRGQVLPFSTRILEASLLGSNEVPAVATDAMGTALVILLNNKIAVRGTFDGLSSAVATDIAGGAHLHLGLPNANGGVAFPLTPTLDTDLLGGSFVAVSNEFTLTEGQVDTLLGGGFYVNIHTVTNAGGEIRGQVLPSTNVSPMEPMITAPADAAEIDIAGDGTADFTVTWDGGDPNGNATFYTWQLATSPEFDTILLEAGTGTDAMFTTTVGDVAALLTSAGVNVGSSITLYHRANATDGSRMSMGEPESVTLNRGAVVAVEDDGTLPERFALEGNYPNPFNPQTTIRFALPDAAEVTVEVFNTLGQQVRTLMGGPLTPGRHELTFDAGALPSGLYLYRVTAQTANDAVTRTGRMMLLK